MAPKPATLDLPALQAASRVLQDQFVKDAQIIPDLGELLSIRKSVRLLLEPEKAHLLHSWRPIVCGVHHLPR